MVDADEFLDVIDVPNHLLNGLEIGGWPNANHATTPGDRTDFLVLKVAVFV